MTSWRDRFVSLVQSYGEVFEAKGKKIPWEERITIQSWTVTLLENCPARYAAPQEPYVDTVSTTRRRLGLLLLREMKNNRSFDLYEFWDRLEQNGFDHPEISPSLGQWLMAMDTFVSASVFTSAATWATQIISMLSLEPETRIEFCSPQGSTQYGVPQSKVTIRASFDAHLNSYSRILLVQNYEADEVKAVSLAGFQALCVAISTNKVPESVTLLFPASGKRQKIIIDEDILTSSFETVSETVSILARYLQGASLETKANNACHFCSLLSSCTDGQDWVNTHPRRYGGLLPIQV